MITIFHKGELTMHRVIIYLYDKYQRLLWHLGYSTNERDVELRRLKMATDFEYCVLYLHKIVTYHPDIVSTIEFMDELLGLDYYTKDLPSKYSDPDIYVPKSTDMNKWLTYNGKVIIDKKTIINEFIDRYRQLKNIEERLNEVSTGACGHNYIVLRNYVAKYDNIISLLTLYVI